MPSMFAGLPPETAMKPKYVPGVLRIVPRTARGLPVTRAEKLSECVTPSKCVMGCPICAPRIRSSHARLCVETVWISVI